MRHNHSPFRDHRLAKALQIILQQLELTLSEVEHNGIANRNEYVLTYRSPSNILLARVATYHRVYGLSLDNLKPLKEIQSGWQSDQILRLTNTRTDRILEFRRKTSVLEFTEKTVRETYVTRKLQKMPHVYLENTLQTLHWK